MFNRIPLFQGALIGLFSFLKLAYPITIIGNDEVSSEEMGFKALKPRTYSLVKRDENKMLLKNHSGGIPFFGSSFNLPTDPQISAELVFRTLPNQFEGLVAETPDEFLYYFNSENRMNSWNLLHLPAGSDPCVVGVISEKKDSINVVLSWGFNKGLLAFGNYPEKLKPELLKMLQSLRLNEGACSWKSN